MKILNTGNFRNIKLNQEFISAKTSDGHEIRLIVDLDTKQVKIQVDHEYLAKCEQNEKCEPYVEVNGFYMS